MSLYKPAIINNMQYAFFFMGYMNIVGFSIVIHNNEIIYTIL